MVNGQSSQRERTQLAVTVTILLDLIAKTEMTVLEKPRKREKRGDTGVKPKSKWKSLVFKSLKKLEEPKKKRMRSAELGEKREGEGGLKKMELLEVEAAVIILVEMEKGAE